jgi:DUF1680 family protein
VIAFPAFQRDVLPSSTALCVRELAYNLGTKPVTILLEIRERIVQPHSAISQKDGYLNIYVSQEKRGISLPVTKTYRVRISNLISLCAGNGCV